MNVWVCACYEFCMLRRRAVSKSSCSVGLRGPSLLARFSSKCSSLSAWNALRGGWKAGAPEPAERVPGMDEYEGAFEYEGGGGGPTALGGGS